MARLKLPTFTKKSESNAVADDAKQGQGQVQARPGESELANDVGPSGTLAAGQAASNAMASNTRWLAPPTSLNEPGGSSSGLNLDANRHGASASVTVGDGFDAASAGVVLGRAALVGQVTAETGLGTTNVMAGSILGRTAVEGNVTVATAQGLVSPDALLGVVGVRGVLLGGGVSFAPNAVPGATGNFYGLAFATNRRDAQALGPTPDGGHRVEIHTTANSGIWAFTGAGLGLVGVGGTLFVDREKEVVYRTTQPAEEAAQTVFADAGLAGRLRSTLEVAGLRKNRLPPPDLSRPEALKVGDEVYLAVRGTYAGGFAAASGIARIGLQAIVEGDFELRVAKLSETAVEVRVQPRHIHGVSAFADSIVPLVLDISKLRAESLGQGFVFDLTQPEAQAAYQNLLVGKLPLDATAAKALHQPDAVASQPLTQALRDEVLPSGVSRLFAASDESTQVNWGGGLEFGKFGRGGGWPGLAKVNTTVEQVETITDGTSTLVEQSKSFDQRQERLRAGVDTLEVRAALRHLYRVENEREQKEFAGLSLEMRFHDTRQSGGEFDRDVVGRLNKTMGLDLAPMGRDGRRLARFVEVRLLLDGPAFQKLSTLSDADARAAASRAGASPDAAVRLAADLRSLGEAPLEAFAEAIQSYVAVEGMPAVGVVHRLLGDELDRFQLYTTAEAYSLPVSEKHRLTLKYRRPMEFSDGPDALATRFEEVSRAREAARHGLADARKDPLLNSEERARLEHELEATDRALTKLVSFDQFGRQDLRELVVQLREGRRTAAKNQLLRFLGAEGFR